MATVHWGTIGKGNNVKVSRKLSADSITLTLNLELGWPSSVQFTVEKAFIFLITGKRKTAPLVNATREWETGCAKVNMALTRPWWAAHKSVRSDARAVERIQVRFSYELPYGRSSYSAR